MPKPLLGTDEHALIPENGDGMIYGDGGTGKTTLSFDLAFHLGVGIDWLEIPVARPARILLIENEGPRALLRRKLRRKLEAWAKADRPAIGEQIRVFEQPWAQLRLDSEYWREELALKVAAYEIDVVIAGPLTRIGMDGRGTLQEVAAFMQLIADVRTRCCRPLTLVVIHHENKGGAVSGAWEGSGDTLLHVQAAGNGHTIVHVQKARWDSERHGTTLKLAWTDGEGFRVEGDRDYLLEIKELLSDGVWRTAKEIAAPEDKGGIGAGVETVREVLDGHPETFESRTGEDAEALGRSATALLWGRT